MITWSANVRPGSRIDAVDTAKHVTAPAGRSSRVRAAARALTFLALPLAFIPLLALATVPSSAVIHPPRIIGVYDSQSGRPIEGVEVRDVNTGTWTTTSQSGAALLTFVVFHDSSARIGLRKLGYRPAELVLREGASEPITVLLDPVVRLPTVRTTAKYRLDTDPGDRAGFERRCQQASPNVVTCLRESYFAERSSYSIADLLKKVPGVSVICSGQGARTGRAGDPSMPTCQVANGCEWYIDGFRFDPFPGQRYLTYAEVQKRLVASDIAGMEVYFNDGPQRFYNPLVGCSFVIWTKP